MSVPGRFRHLTTTEAYKMLDAAIAEAGGVCAFARKSGLSPAYVSRVASGKDPIGARIAKAIGLVPVRGFAREE